LDEWRWSVLGWKQNTLRVNQILEGRNEHLATTSIFSGSRIITSGIAGRRKEVRQMGIAERPSEPGKQPYLTCQVRERQAYLSLQRLLQRREKFPLYRVCKQKIMQHSLLHEPDTE
jgi:hypothetical protein